MNTGLHNFGLSPSTKEDLSKFNITWDRSNIMIDRKEDINLFNQADTSISGSLV